MTNFGVDEGALLFGVGSYTSLISVPTHTDNTHERRELNESVPPSPQNGDPRFSKMEVCVAPAAGGVRVENRSEL